MPGAPPAPTIPGIAGTPGKLRPLVIAATIAGFIPPICAMIAWGFICAIICAGPAAPIPAPASIAELSIGGIRFGNELGIVGGATIEHPVLGAAGASVISMTEIFLPG